MSAWIVRHGLSVMAAALVLMLLAAVFGTFSPWTAAGLAFAAIVLLVGGLFTSALVTERAWRREERRREQNEATRRPVGWPSARFSVSADLRAPVKTRPINKAIDRNERRHGGVSS